MSRVVVAFLLALLVPALFAGCDAPMSAPLADASSTSCATDADCDDHLFCSGLERCTRGLCTRTDACRMGQTCDEAHDDCLTRCDQTEDADGDGARAVECGGDDCDDANPDRAPGRTEVCDIANVDEDCDPTTFGVRDLDGDGVADASCCNVASDGARHCGMDCDDTSSSVSPRAPEVCNGLDDDCDGAIDESVLLSFYIDADGDGYGALGASAMTSCGRPIGYAPTADDCDDHNRAINPGAVEICDGAVDEDCSGAVDDVPGGCACLDGQSRDCGLVGRCTGATQICNHGMYGACSIASSAETCNAMDDDCDGMVDEALTVTCFRDDDNDGAATFGSVASQQCPDDARAASPALRCPHDFTGVEPTSPQTGDCDDSRALQSTPDACYADHDHDSYGAGTPTWKCPADPCPSGLVNNQRDCCDGDAAMHPGQTTYSSSGGVCGSDFDCDGTIEHRYGTYTCTPFGSGCVAGAVGGDSVSPYMRGNVGCGAIGQYADGCMRVGASCNFTWSGATGTGSYSVQACR